MLLAQIVVVLVFGFVLVSLGRTAFSFAPWVPSSTRVVREGLQLAGLAPGETLYDLGCGDGRIVTVAARDFGARAVGVELSRALILVCHLRRLRPANRGARFVRGDLFATDVRDADVVYLYGVPGALRDRLLGMLDAQLRPGTRVMAYSYALGGRTPDATRPDHGLAERPLYVYHWPARTLVAGAPGTDAPEGPAMPPVLTGA